MASNPRQANGHRRRELRRRILREESHCGICGKPVDKTLKTPHPGSPEVDEIIPISMGGDPLDRRNCRLTHRSCNRARSNGVRGATGKKYVQPLTGTWTW